MSSERDHPIVACSEDADSARGAPSVAIGVSGGMQEDNVVTADGQLGFRVAGGNGLHAAAGARLWMGSCLLASNAPENFPETWMRQLTDAGIDTRFVSVLSGYRPDVLEWFFYEADGSRRDLIFASPSDVAAAGMRLPSGPDAHAKLGKSEVNRLKALVQAISARTAKPTPPARPGVGPADVAERLLASEAAHLAPNSYPAHLTVSQRLATAGRVVSLDPGHYVKQLPTGQLAELLRWVTIFLPSEREVYEFRGPCDLEQAAIDFAGMGPAIVVIKVGAQGSIVYDRRAGRLQHVPALPGRVLDPTGCGDSYCGGFLAGYIERGAAFDAALYGTVAASFTAEGLGATYPLRFSRQDAESRLTDLRTLMGTRT